ncbi:MAG TPA: hypothetical protein VM869_32685 [Enhygromyxa sp.]|nr:hypothetical protein [Enhygromyxa sp.]
MQTIIVDGVRWELDFVGFATSLRASSELGELRLRPWSCVEHFGAMRRHLRVGERGLELDGPGYADDLLSSATIERRVHELGESLVRGLALWWAAGVAPGERERAPRPDADGWLALDDDRSARVRVWTWGERLLAQRAQLNEGEGERDFDPLGYLEGLLRACVVELVDRRASEPLELESLDAGATRLLLRAVTELNHPDPDDDPLAQLSPALAGSVLRLCAALGWTPERVLATPAFEVQRLLGLLDRVEVGRPAARSSGRRRAGSRRPRIADHPDAIVIQFDGPEGSSE